VTETTWLDATALVGRGEVSHAELVDAVIARFEATRGHGQHG
jgi:hypothetical protein